MTAATPRREAKTEVTLRTGGVWFKARERVLPVPGQGVRTRRWAGDIMVTVYDIVTVTCFAWVVLTYFMFTEGGMRALAHFMLPAAAFAIANQVGNAALQASNAALNLLAMILIVAGIAYTYIIVRH